MGHYRGRDNRKRRESRRRRNEAAISRRPASLADLAATLFDSLVQIGRVIYDGFKVAAEFIVDSVQSLVAYMIEYQFTLLPPPTPIALSELRTICGGDGATMPLARFTAEGGFSLN